MSKLKIGLLIILGIAVIVILSAFCGYLFTPWDSIQNDVRRESGKLIGNLSKEDYSNITLLSVVDIPGNRVKDFYNLEKLENLNTLLLVTDNISAFDSLKNVPSLRKLYLEIKPNTDDKPAFDLEAVTEIESLKFLSLTTHQLIDLSSLANLTTLETLELNYSTNYTNYLFYPIPSLKSLKIICPPHLITNYKINLDHLTGMTNLEEFTSDLQCSSNLNSLSSMTNLKILWLRKGAYIDDLSPLINCPNLENLGVDGHQITDLTPLLELKNLKKLNIVLNPLDENSINEIIPVLRERGVDLRF